MSRTVHHTPLHRWNIREHDPDTPYHWPHQYGYDYPVGNVVHDLRYAGPTRTVQYVRRRVRFYGYPWTMTPGVNIRAAEMKAAGRAALRTYRREVIKAYRHGVGFAYGDDAAVTDDAYDAVGDLIEPDPRHRHGALWDAW